MDPLSAFRHIARDCGTNHSCGKNVLLVKPLRPAAKRIPNMKAFVLKHKALTTIAGLLAVIALAAGWSASASVRGRLAGYSKIRRGQYAILTYGAPPSERPEYARLLKERYGIELRAVAGCIVSEPLMSYVEGYDEVSAAAAKQKFGHDVFRECWDEARKNSEERPSEEASKE